MAGEYAAPPACITGLMDLGTGTALAIESQGLTELRELIADHFHGALTAQDNHSLGWHITIQNKVTKTEARTFQASLIKRQSPVISASLASAFTFTAEARGRRWGDGRSGAQGG